ncbi:unnamed protein product, partial [Iphiclides podalirius]
MLITDLVDKFCRTVMLTHHDSYFLKLDELKVASLFTAYFVLFKHLFDMAMGIYVHTRTDDIVKVVEKEGIWVSEIIHVMFVAFLTTTTLIAAVVLIVGLHKNNRDIIRIYLWWATFSLLLHISFIIFHTFLYAWDLDATCRGVMIIALNYFYRFVIKSYWIRFEPGVETQTNSALPGETNKKKSDLWHLPLRGTHSITIVVSGTTKIKGSE